jgi:UDP-galactopyranose mutase
MIYTGPIDYFFDYKYGKLHYRSLRFEWQTFDQEFYQPTAQVNYVDASVDYTRLIEHKRLSKSKSRYTTISKEYSLKEGEPFYPIPNDENRKKYFQYKQDAKELDNIIFCGRLAEYQYYNMDQVVIRALYIFNEKIK